MLVSMSTSRVLHFFLQATTNEKRQTSKSSASAVTSLCKIRIWLNFLNNLIHPCGFENNNTTETLTSLYYRSKNVCVCEEKVYIDRLEA